MSEIQRFRVRHEIPAIQWTGDNDAEIEAFTGTWAPGLTVFRASHAEGQHAAMLYVRRLSSYIEMPVGAWAVAAVDGEGFVSIEAEDFASVYEPVPDTSATVPVESAFLRQVLTDAIRACEADVMADGEAMQGLLSEYRAELAGLPAEGPAERAVSKPERRVAAPAVGEAPAAPGATEGRAGVPDEIKFASDLIPLILSGAKTLTYRLDGKFDTVQAGDVLRLIDAGTGEAWGSIEVTSAHGTRVGELDPADPRHEAYRDLRHLRRCLAVYYGKPVGTIEPVTVIEFRLTEGGAP